MNRLKFAVLLFGVFISSFAVITFEISLTRIFSVMYSYHYTFLAVSVALFALGLGGILTQALSWEISLDNVFKRLSILSLIFSFVASFLIVAMLSVPSATMLGDMFLVFLPFFISGVLLATIYKIFVTFSNIVYFADLFGAAIGALVVVFVLNLVGPIQAILLVSMFISVAGLLFALVSTKKKVIFVAIAGIILAAFFARYSNYTNQLNLRPMANEQKELENILSDQSLGAKIVDSRWSAFGRTDLVELKSEPHYKLIFVDGGAGTRMFHFNGDFNSSLTEVAFLKNSTQYFPYYFAEKETSLVIGPGGGLDVLTSLMSGTNHTTAVEVNPDIVNIVRDYSNYDGGIYTRYNNVHVYSDEGRSFVKRSTQQYDIIMLDIPVTKTSQGMVGYALAENYLFTTDSFVDFLNHLNNDGLLTIVAHQQAEVYKLVSLAFKVLKDQGLDAREIMRRVVVVGGQGHHSGFPVFMLKKTPFTDKQTTLMAEKAKELGFMPSYIPYVNSDSFDSALRDLASGKVSIDQLISLAPFDIAPPSDDNPFFYKFEKGIPETLSQLLNGTIILSTIVSGLYLRVYFKTWKEQRRLLKTWKRHRQLTWKKKSFSRASGLSLFKPYYFASLGLGFMLIEIPLIQKFVLFLGHPTLAIAAVLFSLLLASGLGSFYSRKWKNSQLHEVFGVALFIGIAVFLYLLIVPSVFSMFLSYNSLIRFFISFALIFPLGFLMGIPFPTGLKIGRKEFREDAAWMWVINGAFSVLGSVLALVVAMSFNFNTALLMGALTYIGIFLVGSAWSNKRMKTEKVGEKSSNSNN